MSLFYCPRSITPKTKVLLLNSPHNPTGKVFTKRELEGIAEIVKENPQLTVVSDEVYKFTIYNPIEEGDETAKGHYHFARFPGKTFALILGILFNNSILLGMWDRTITLSSCGKTFSVTGWQVGWMVGSPKYIKPVQDIIPCIQFCASTPVQQALTLALKQAELPYKGSERLVDVIQCANKSLKCEFLVTTSGCDSNFKRNAQRLRRDFSHLA